MLKTADDIMTESVVTVQTDTPLAEAVTLLTRHSFNGLPVVDKDGKLVGLFTERNIISDQSYIHLKTLLKLFSGLEFYKKDNSPIKQDLKDLINLKVRDVMTPKPATVKSSSTIEQVAQLFANPMNNPLPVVDDSSKLVGILSVSDLTRFYGVATKRIIDEKNVDHQVDQFVDKFEQEFMVVSKARARTWLIASVLFAVVGFVVAWLLILRITI